MSRHRKVQLSRSKAILIAAAGAFSVVTAASAAGVTWPRETQAQPARPAEAAGAAHAATQITWGLEYIKSTYGSPCGAWAHELAAGWY